MVARVGDMRDDGCAGTYEEADVGGSLRCARVLLLNVTATLLFFLEP